MNDQDSSVNSVPALERAHTVGARLFADQGYAGTTTRELSAAMGVTNGTLYHHFDSKEQLLYGICLDALERGFQLVSESVTPIDDPLVALDAFLRTHVKMIAESQEMQTTMLIELRSLNDEHRGEIIKLRDQYERVAHDLIVACQDDQRLRDDIGPSMLTRMLFNLMNWTIFWYREDGRLSAEEIGDRMAKLYFDGARGPIQSRKS